MINLARIQENKHFSLITPKLPYFVVTLAALFAMILFAYPSLSKPYIMDEMEFPSVARAISESSKPFYYRGELRPNNIGLWHPPLYIVWYAFWFKIFGSSVDSARVFGLFNAGMTLIVASIFIWHRQRDLENESRPALRVAAFLFALSISATSPLFIHGSLLPDIDTQILPLLTITFLLLFFEISHRKTRRLIKWTVLVLGSAFLIYAKLTTIALILPTLLVYELTESLREGSVFRVKIKRSQGKGGGWSGYHRVIVMVSSSWRNSILRLACVTGAFLIAMVVFLVSWMVIANLWGVDYRYPFLYLSQSANNPLNFSGSDNILIVLSVVLSDMQPHFSYAVQWIGLPALLLVFILIMREFRLDGRGILRRSERLALLTFFLVLLFMYLVLRPAPFVFPKYWPPLIPILTLLTADVLLSLKGNRRSWLALASILVGIIAYQVYIWINPVTTGKDFILAIYTKWPKEPLVFAWQIWPLIAAMSLAGIAAFLMRQSLRMAFTVALVTVTLGWQVNVVSQQMQAPYSTTYMYGEQSIQHVVDYLRQTLPDGVIVIAPKDVGYMLQDRWRYIELYADPRPHLDMPGVHALVVRTNDYYGNTIRETPDIAAAVAERFMPHATIGNFTVLIRRP